MVSARDSDLQRIASCEGKVRFGSFQRAAQVASRQAGRRGDSRQAYACRFCGGFHVGTSVSGEARPKLRIRESRKPYGVYVRAHGLKDESLLGWSIFEDGHDLLPLVPPGCEVARIVKRAVK